jgi:hypothetical protein
MNAMRTVVSALFLLLPLSAQAETYCKVNAGQYSLGEKTAAVKMKVVADTVKRPERIPGQEPSAWCVINFYGYAFYKPIELVQKPKLGKVETAQYRVRYRASKPGTDTFVFKVHQMDRMNETAEMTATVEVEVVPAAF